jgi:microcin C transport system substrate-binding protein
MNRRDLLALGALGLTFPLPRAARAVVPAGGDKPGEVVRTHALSLLAEPRLPADFPHWPWANPNALKGGEVVLSRLGSFDSFNPYILRGTPDAGVGLIYDTLMAGNPDEATAEYGHLAEIVELPADRRGVSFELRATARWHDGRPVTAEDVVFTFNALRTHGRPFFRAYWADVTEVVAESPRRVTFRFRDADNRELAQILGDLPVLPKHWWEGRDFARPSLDVPLGSGPYRLDRFETNRSVVYRRVEDYWARDLGVRRGTNNFDLLRYEYFRDTTVAFEAFKAAQTDFRTENVARLGHRLRLAAAAGAAEPAPAVRHHAGRAGHPLPPRALAACRRDAAAVDTRLAGLGGRVPAGDRPTHRPHRARWPCGHRRRCRWWCRACSLWSR